MRVPVFAQTMDQARTALRAHVGRPVWQPGQNIDGFVDAQHCTYLVQVALTALLAERGIVPDATLGHSVGEVAAAHTAGTLGLDSSARVIAHRSRLLDALAGAGGLLAIRADVQKVEEFLAAYGGRLSIASYSAPQLQVVASPYGDLLHLHTVLEAEGVWSRTVRDVIPAHSPAVDPLVSELEQALEGLSVQGPRLPAVSTAHPGQTPTSPELWGPAYWAKQVRQPVRFTDALSQALGLFGDEPVVFVEVGPKALLAEHITHTLGSQHPTVAVTADPTGLARGIGELYTHGITPTGPVHRAHPSLVVSPGGDHTTGPRTSTESDPDPLPSPYGVEAHLAAEIARMLHLPEGLDLRCSWADLGLQSHQLIQLTSRLRLVPAWTNVDIQLFLPDRPLTQVVDDLRALLQRPSTTTEKGWSAVLH